VRGGIIENQHDLTHVPEGGVACELERLRGLPRLLEFDPEVEAVADVDDPIRPPLLAVLSHEAPEHSERPARLGFDSAFEHWESSQGWG